MTTTITIDDLARQLDPVGVEEVAQRLGVERQTVSQWRWRNKLPEPRWTISNRPAWAWQDIAAWARDTGRLND
jgi:predicted DNA-binding transcriptional regulator AlpA